MQEPCREVKLMCWDSLRKRKKHPWGAQPASGERCWSLERNGIESVNHWRPEPECTEDDGSNVSWWQIVVSAGLKILPKLENWIKLSCTPHHLQTELIPRDMWTLGCLCLHPSGLLWWPEPCVVCFDLRSEEDPYRRYGQWRRLAFRKWRNEERLENLLFLDPDEINFHAVSQDQWCNLCCGVFPSIQIQIASINSQVLW